MNLIGWTIDHQIKDVNALGGSLTLEEEREIRVESGPRRRIQQVAEKGSSTALPSSLVVATYYYVRLTPRDFGRLVSERF